MYERIRTAIGHLCDVVELCLAVVVGITLVLTGVCDLLRVLNVWTGGWDAPAFMVFLKYIFNLVVGLEFTKMLLKPVMNNVLEVLVFLVTRHMILGENSAMDLLLSVVSILLLYGFHFLLRHWRHAAPIKFTPHPRSGKAPAHDADGAAH